MGTLRWMRVVGLTLGAGVLLSGAGWAQGPGPCKEDAKKLCGDIKPGQGRVMRCMHEKESQLSPACAEHLKQAQAEHRERAEACRDDRKKFCGDVKPGQGRVAACMKQHEAELSAACKKEMPQG